MCKKENIETDDNAVNLVWVQIPRSNLRQEFKTFGVKTMFNLGRTLKSLICKNKSKLLVNSFAAIHQSTCPCNALYSEETNKEVITRIMEHQQYSLNGT